MKTRLMALMALALGMASCQVDSILGIGSRSEVNVQLSFSAPDLIGDTRTDGDAQSQLNSAYGAIDYLDGAPLDDSRYVDWNDVDLRYSLEIYDAENLNAPIKDRMVVIKDKYEPVRFDLRLIAGREYRFAIFADFVSNGLAQEEVNPDVDAQRDLGMRHTIGVNLTDIAIKQDTDSLNDEVADAYFTYFNYTPEEGVEGNIVEKTLTRPYAKVRVVATDLAELNLNVHPKYVTVKYNSDIVIPTAFNAVKGKILGDKSVEGKSISATYVSKIRDNRESHVYNAEYDAMFTVADNGAERASHLTLCTDYILATSGEHTPINFTMTVLDENKEKIREVEFDTQIPIERNYLTTIVGNVLTKVTEVNVSINDDFNNSKNSEDAPFYEEVE
ncbi:MAG: hypothetical protein J6U93_05470 [Alistipes sp.]|nr:hypothetical protein [Alistipes sp.]